MDATIIARTPTSFTLQVEVPYNDSMLGFEEALQQRLNDAGVLATAERLKRFDTDGAPITVGAVKLTTKGPVEKDYQTPYGVATVARHVYQSPDGGKTYCPLDRDARIVVSSTPRFAKVLSHKVAIHQCRSALGTAICRRTGTLANGRPSVLSITVLGFHPRRAG